MIFVVSSAEVRLGVIRDLKDAGFGAAAPKEDDVGQEGYRLYVGDVPRGDEGQVEQIVLALDPAARRLESG